MPKNVRYIRDGEGRIVYHDRWPKDACERLGASITFDIHEGNSSIGLEEGDVVYIDDVPVWDEDHHRRLQEMNLEPVFQEPVDYA